MKVGNKEADRLIQQVRDAGWRVERGKGHVKLFPPTRDAEMIVIATTPGDWRSILNARARIRRSDPSFNK